MKRRRNKPDLAKEEMRRRRFLPTSASSMTMPVDLARALSAASREEKWTKA